MSWAQDRAARIKQEQDALIARQERAIKANEIIARNANQLWELLVSALQKETKEFADNLPLAKQSNLRADRLNANNLTISSQVFPIIRLEIVYNRDAQCIEREMTTIYHGLGEQRSETLTDIRFTVDSDMQPCFTNVTRYLSPAQMAEDTMESVAGFFEYALKMPKYLA